MARYGAGDAAAFGLVYDAVAPVLLGYLRRRTHGDEALVEDLVQQTFLKMHCHRAHFIPGAEVLPWAVAIAVRLLIDRTRRDRRAALLFSAHGAETPDGASPDAGPEELAGAAELARRLDSRILDLPTPHRVALEVIRGDGLSFTEAAGLLATTVTAIKLRLFRACRTLRRSLADAEGEHRAGAARVPSRAASQRAPQGRPHGRTFR